MAGFDDLDFGEDEALPTASTASRARTRRLPKFDRLVIALLLSIAVILPFVSAPARIGDLPPKQFAAGSRQQAVFDRLDSVKPRELVLVAAEYGPTGAGELDTALDALLRHIMLRGGRPVVVSGNAVGLLHARNILDEIAGDPAFLSAVDRPQTFNPGGIIMSPAIWRPAQLACALLARTSPACCQSMWTEIPLASRPSPCVTLS